MKAFYQSFWFPIVLVIVLWFLAMGGAMVETPDGQLHQVVPNPTAFLDAYSADLCDVSKGIMEMAGKDPNSLDHCQPGYVRPTSWLDEPITTLYIDPIVIPAPQALQSLPTPLPCGNCGY